MCNISEDLPVKTLVAPLLLAAVAAAPVAAQDPVPALDSAKVKAGKALFEGRGLCFSCHGMSGEGMLGPTTRLNATKDAWLHHDGTLAGVVALIKRGVDDEQSKSGQVMPPMGGAKLSDAQVEQVASYVLHLHRQQPKQ